MKMKVKKCHADGLYMIRSQASSNNLYFETKEDHELFFQLLNRYLSEMIEIVHYALLPKGWILIFRSQNDQKIEDTYLKYRSESKKAKAESQKTKTCDMLSEHIRFFISAYVKQTNAKHGRHGAMVHSRIEKYIFPSVAEMQKEIDKIEALEEFNAQFLEKYRANLEYYDSDKKLEAEDELKSAKVYYGSKRLKNKVVQGFCVLLDLIDVVGKLIQTTLNTHFPHLQTLSIKPKLE